MKIPNRVRYFNKLILNRLARKVAGASHSPFALVRHVGRRSGKPYETPVIVQPIHEGFVLALTYGPEVDWYRNILANGYCHIMWHGKEYAVETLEPVDVKTALPAYPLLERSILRVVGIQHFLRMKYEAVGRTPERASA
jgi:deazaflavin-dependent oxidoreductase (nitroreductase family)